MPPCHGHMVIATNFSSMFDLLLCSTPQTWAECCLELTAVSSYRMFPLKGGGIEWGVIWPLHAHLIQQPSCGLLTIDMY